MPSNSAANFVETSCGQIFFVRDLDDVNLSHVWEGVEMKRVRGGYASKKNARPVLVRKIGSRILSAGA